MYEARTPKPSSHDLLHGDILRNLLQPAVPTEKHFVIVKPKSKQMEQASPDVIGATPNDLRVAPSVRRMDLALVVSNSCDNTGDWPVVLAPIRPFQFSPEATSPNSQWQVVSEAATGTASPKLFYLPGSSRFRFQRSEAQLARLFSVSHGYLDRCFKEAGTERACGLQPEAQRHLRWALGLFFGRNSREDYDWPSAEDIELKMTWLESQLRDGTSSRARYEADLEMARKRRDALRGEEGKR
ncbi:MAG: hypothetical protein QME96_01840 [Myxococcota bacterium]|nr:hypothetical protein [Myxococcota bacterium]